MRIFNLSRGQGKTMRMLYASEYHNAHILCTTGKSKQHIMDMAKYYSIHIPEPITVADIVCDKANGKNVNEVLVDDMDNVFSQLLSYLGYKMIGGTITTNNEVSNG